MLYIKYILPLTIIILAFKETECSEDRYLRYVKDSCFLRGEAFSCVKYKALKIAKKTLFGDMNNNKTIIANKIISFVPLDEDTIANLTESDGVDLIPNESKGFLSEWTEIANYFMTLVKEFFKIRGLRVNLPEGARTVEDQEEVDGGRGKKKKLAVMIPLLNLMATMKTKMLLIPILLGVMLIKKLLLIAALLLPSLLSTLKACKHHHPMTHYSYFGAGDSSDYNSEYSNSYSYGSGGAYGKDWPTNRAYSVPKQRTPSPVYITAPGASA